MNVKNNDLACIIDKYLYNFTFCLLKNIFLPSELPKEKEEKLNIIMEKINKNIIKNEKKYLNFDYSIKNFENIVNFIKGQNLIYAAEILEIILLNIFAKVINVPKDKTVNDYIYNNLTKIRDNEVYLTWFQQEKLNPKELRNLSDYINKSKMDSFLNSPFSYLLYRINLEKYNLIKITKNKNSSVMKYIYNDCIPNETLMDYIYNFIKINQKNIIDKDISYNSIMHLMNKYLIKPDKNDVSLYTDLIRRFLYSVFIYYQTKNSPLINYGKKILNQNNKKNLVSVPYSFDLSRAYVEGRYSNVIISPIRAEKRIENILIEENNLRESGMYELGKTLVFNTNIKHIDLSRSLVKSNYLDYLILGMGIFDNYSVNVLNLAYNYLNENCAKNLGRIIHKFKELKTLVLKNNDLKEGLAQFFVVLKNLYKNNETKIEKLILNKCFLDDASFVELGELLKNKYCKLKMLYIIGNNLSRSTNFLSKLKKNKILTDIYIGKNNINKENVNDINKIISNTNITSLNVYKNNITNFKDILRIISRTRLIRQDENEKNIHLLDKSKSVLKHLDISQNDSSIKSKEHIKILSKIIKETTVPILDISKILKGEFPGKMIKKYQNMNYNQEVDNLTKNLEEEKEIYKEIYKEKVNLSVDIKRINEENEDGFDYNIFNKIDKNLTVFLHDKKADSPLYLLEKANKLINEHRDEFNEINEENKENMVKKLANYIMLFKKKEELKIISKKEELYNLIIM